MENSLYRMNLNRDVSLPYFAALALAVSIVLGSCRQDRHVWIKGQGNYPEHIAKIIQNNCTQPGCHNQNSRAGASGLSLESWDALFEGTNNGAAVIPYKPLNSTLFQFCNYLDELGPSARPTMPINNPPLSREDLILLKKWIEEGAPNSKGFVKFSDNPGRSKYYVVNQGCDEVTVFDAESGLPMRMVQVGHDPNIIESPHQIRVSSDQQFYYVLFLGGSYFQKYRCSDDSFVGEVNIGRGTYNTFLISKDNRFAWLCDFNSVEDATSGQGLITYVDLDQMTVRKKYQGIGLFNYPHGIMLNQENTLLYVFQQEGSGFYKVVMNPDSGSSPTAPEISPAKQMDGTNGLLLKPHDAVFNQDGSRYFVTCQGTNELRVFNKQDQLVGTLPLGVFPQEVVYSAKQNRVFVSCMEDPVPGQPLKRGSVYVIDAGSLQIITRVHPGFQPHGIAIDETRGLLLIANRNINQSGPTPHHTSACGGRNGFVTAMDLKTLEMVPGWNVEVTADPYFIDVRE